MNSETVYIFYAQLHFLTLKNMKEEKTGYEQKAQLEEFFSSKGLSEMEGMSGILKAGKLH